MSAALRIRNSRGGALPRGRPFSNQSRGGGRAEHLEESAGRRRAAARSATRSASDSRAQQAVLRLVEFHVVGRGFGLDALDVGDLVIVALDLDRRRRGILSVISSVRTRPSQQPDDGRAEDQPAAPLSMREIVAQQRSPRRGSPGRHGGRLRFGGAGRARYAAKLRSFILVPSTGTSIAVLQQGDERRRDQGAACRISRKRRRARSSPTTTTSLAKISGSA